MYEAKIKTLVNLGLDHIRIEFVRNFSGRRELANILRVIHSAEIRVLSIEPIEGLKISAHLEIRFQREETYVADIELGHPGLDDPRLGVGFADAILDEAQDYAELHFLNLEEEYGGFA